MNYQEKYKEALDKAKDMLKYKEVRQEDMEYLFPELKESEDERIRKELKALITWAKSYSASGVTMEDAETMMNWLETQGEQKKDARWESLEKLLEADSIYQMAMNDAMVEEAKNKAIKALQELAVSKLLRLEKQDEQPQVYTTEDGEIITYSETDGYKVVEPKFKVGDWIISNTANEDYRICKITEIKNGCYTIESIYGYKGYNHFNVFEESYRLWTIEDAKDGDVLAYVSDEEDLWIMIYWSLYEPYEGHVHYHALLVNDEFSGKGTCCICIDNLKPATKEQRELLFQKVKEAGYEWDVDKKKLKKIHVIDEGKAEMDHCFTKMMNGEKVSSVWSEEDEKKFRDVIRIIEQGAPVQSMRDHYTNWFKSLRQRYIWKPSDEQMKALANALSLAKNCGEESAFDLRTLHEDLKKLTE